MLRVQGCELGWEWSPVWSMLGSECHGTLHASADQGLLAVQVYLKPQDGGGHPGGVTRRAGSPASGRLENTSIYRCWEVAPQRSQQRDTQGQIGSGDSTKENRAAG